MYTLKLYKDLSFDSTVALVLNGTVSGGETVIINYDSDSAGNFSTYFADDGIVDGLKANFSSGIADINGNDAITLEFNGTVVDTFGVIGFNPVRTGEWNYKTGFAVRNITQATPNTNGTFKLDDWEFSGRNSLRNCKTNIKNTETGCKVNFPLGWRNNFPDGWRPDFSW